MDSEELFKTQRPRLLAIAYGMLGSASDAEDVVQEAFLRWQRGGTDRVDFPERYLARIVTRLSIDHLRAVKRRREDYVGVWLPEPVTGDDPDPEGMTLLADSLSFALLRVLETLTPVERAVFLLCEVFAYRHSEVGRMIRKTEANTRQILHRARTRVIAERPSRPVSRGETERLVSAFLEAAARGTWRRSSRSWTKTSCGTGTAAARRPLCFSRCAARQKRHGLPSDWPASSGRTRRFGSQT